MQIVCDRQQLHRIPELDRCLPKTMEYLRAALSQLPCRVEEPMAGSLAAYFDFGGEKTLAFRADMDALPIEEKTGLPFASTHPGQMHACGHDGHMAVLLELARRLGTKKDLRHNVLLLFQPAEETTGGARMLCETGILERYGVTAVFGLHLWPGLPAGQVYSCPGPMMSRSCEVQVTVTGKSAHIAKAREGLDAMEAGFLFYSKIRQLHQAEEAFHVLNFGRMESGTVCNAVSGLTRFHGTLRAFRDDVFFRLQALIRRAAEETAQETGCRVEIAMSEGYPPVCNPENLLRQVAKLTEIHILEAPSLTTEDFSWYQRYVPGLFFFLGTGDTPALHSDNFDFPEQILLRGAELFETIAEDFS